MKRILSATAVVAVLLVAGAIANDVLDWERVPDPPQEYIGEASQQEVRQVINRIFPGALERTSLIKGSNFKLVSAEEMRRFLEEDKHIEMEIDPRTGSMLATRLRGQIATPGWERTPFGVAYAANKAANVFITREQLILVVYLIDPKTGEMTRVTQPQDEVRWVDIE